jgi:hypothetical protein
VTTAPLLVFAQAAGAAVDIDAWCAHSARFFATRIGLGNEPHAFVIAPDGGPPGIRTVTPRPCVEVDWLAADAAEPHAGAGLAALARRCKAVWLVSRESATDPLALRLAAILASVLLGPILDPATGEIFGVKTARAKLEAQARRAGD